MNKIRNYERYGQVSIKAADRLTTSVFDDREGTQAFPVFSSGWRGMQMTLILR